MHKCNPGNSIQKEKILKKRWTGHGWNVFYQKRLFSERWPGVMQQQQQQHVMQQQQQ